MTLKALKDEVEKAGFTPSEGSLEDANIVCAFSVETVPGAMGHPRFEASYNKLNGWTKIGNKSWNVGVDIFPGLIAEDKLIR